MKSTSAAFDEAEEPVRQRNKDEHLNEPIPIANKMMKTENDTPPAARRENDPHPQTEQQSNSTSASEKAEDAGERGICFRGEPGAGEHGALMMRAASSKEASSAEAEAVDKAFRNMMVELALGEVGSAASDSGSASAAAVGAAGAEAPAPRNGHPPGRGENKVGEDTSTRAPVPGTVSKAASPVFSFTKAPELPRQETCGGGSSVAAELGARPPRPPGPPPEAQISPAAAGAPAEQAAPASADASSLEPEQQNKADKDLIDERTASSTSGTEQEQRTVGHPQPEPPVVAAATTVVVTGAEQKVQLEPAAAVAADHTCGARHEERDAAPADRQPEDVAAPSTDSQAIGITGGHPSAFEGANKVDHAATMSKSAAGEPVVREDHAATMSPVEVQGDQTAGPGPPDAADAPASEPLVVAPATLPQPRVAAAVVPSGPVGDESATAKSLSTPAATTEPAAVLAAGRETEPAAASSAVRDPPPAADSHDEQDTQTAAGVVRKIGEELGKNVDKFIEILEDNWIESVDDLREITENQFASWKFPLKLAQKIMKFVRTPAPEVVPSAAGVVEAVKAESGGQRSLEAGARVNEEAMLNKSKVGVVDEQVAAMNEAGESGGNKSEVLKMNLPGESANSSAEVAPLAAEREGANASANVVVGTCAAAAPAVEQAGAPGTRSAVGSGALAAAALPPAASHRYNTRSKAAAHNAAAAPLQQNAANKSTNKVQESRYFPDFTKDISQICSANSSRAATIINDLSRFVTEEVRKVADTVGEGAELEFSVPMGGHIVKVESSIHPSGAAVPPQTPTSAGPAPTPKNLTLNLTETNRMNLSQQHGGGQPHQCGHGQLLHPLGPGGGGGQHHLHHGGGGSTSHSHKRSLSSHHKRSGDVWDADHEKARCRQRQEELRQYCNNQGLGGRLHQIREELHPPGSVSSSSRKRRKNQMPNRCSSIQPLDHRQSLLQQAHAAFRKSRGSRSGRHKEKRNNAGAGVVAGAAAAAASAAAIGAPAGGTGKDKQAELSHQRPSTSHPPVQAGPGSTAGVLAQQQKKRSRVGVQQGADAGSDGDAATTGSKPKVARKATTRHADAEQKRPPAPPPAIAQHHNKLSRDHSCSSSASAEGGSSYEPTSCATSTIDTCSASDSSNPDSLLNGVAAKEQGRATTEQPAGPTTGASTHAGKATAPATVDDRDAGSPDHSRDAQAGKSQKKSKDATASMGKNKFKSERKVKQKEKPVLEEEVLLDAEARANTGHERGELHQVAAPQLESDEENGSEVPDVVNESVHLPDCFGLDEDEDEAEVEVEAAARGLGGVGGAPVYGDVVEDVEVEVDDFSPAARSCHGRGGTEAVHNFSPPPSRGGSNLLGGGGQGHGHQHHQLKRGRGRTNSLEQRKDKKQKREKSPMRGGPSTTEEDIAHHAKEILTTEHVVSSDEEEERCPIRRRTRGVANQEKLWNRRLFLWHYEHWIHFEAKRFEELVGREVLPFLTYKRMEDVVFRLPVAGPRDRGAGTTASSAQHQATTDRSHGGGTTTTRAARDNNNSTTSQDQQQKVTELTAALVRQLSVRTVLCEECLMWPECESLFDCSVVLYRNMKEIPNLGTLEFVFPGVNEKLPSLGHSVRTADIGQCKWHSLYADMDSVTFEKYWHQFPRCNISTGRSRPDLLKYIRDLKVKEGGGISDSSDPENVALASNDDDHDTSEIVYCHNQRFGAAHIERVPGREARIAGQADPAEVLRDRLLGIGLSTAKEQDLLLQRCVLLHARLIEKQTHWFYRQNTLRKGSEEERRELQRQDDVIAKRREMMLTQNVTSFRAPVPAGSPVVGPSVVRQQHVAPATTVSSLHPTAGAGMSANSGTAANATSAGAAARAGRPRAKTGGSEVVDRGHVSEKPRARTRSASKVRVGVAPAGSSSTSSNKAAVAKAGAVGKQGSGCKGGGGGVEIAKGKQQSAGGPPATVSKSKTVSKSSTTAVTQPTNTKGSGKTSDKSASASLTDTTTLQQSKSGSGRSGPITAADTKTDVKVNAERQKSPGKGKPQAKEDCMLVPKEVESRPAGAEHAAAPSTAAPASMKSAAGATSAPAAKNGVEKKVSKQPPSRQGSAASKQESATSSCSAAPAVTTNSKQATASSTTLAVASSSGTTSSSKAAPPMKAAAASTSSIPMKIVPPSTSTTSTGNTASKGGSSSSSAMKAQPASGSGALASNATRARTASKDSVKSMKSGAVVVKPAPKSAAANANATAKKEASSSSSSSSAGNSAKGGKANAIGSGARATTGTGGGSSSSSSSAGNKAAAGTGTAAAVRGRASSKQSVSNEPSASASSSVAKKKKQPEKEEKKQLKYPRKIYNLDEVPNCDLRPRSGIWNFAVLPPLWESGLYEYNNASIRWFKRKGGEKLCDINRFKEALREFGDYATFQQNVQNLVNTKQAHEISQLGCAVRRHSPQGSPLLLAVGNGNGKGGTCTPLGTGGYTIKSSASAKPSPKAAPAGAAASSSSSSSFKVSGEDLGLGLMLADYKSCVDHVEQQGGASRGAGASSGKNAAVQPAAGGSSSSSSPTLCSGASSSAAHKRKGSPAAGSDAGSSSSKAGKKAKKPKLGGGKKEKKNDGEDEDEDSSSIELSRSDDGRPLGGHAGSKKAK